jgi:F0F1-type ATP synthase assembly protein I
MAGKDERGWGKALGVGFEMITGMGLGAALGFWWDKHHASSPTGLVVGLVVGGAAGMYLMVKEVIRINKE